MTLGSKFRPYGQNETLISSIRNIIKNSFRMIADDAGAKRFHVIVDDRSHPTKSLI
ncbi:2683_t:CDS:2, partial [Diversispora eburnea]